MGRARVVVVIEAELAKWSSATHYNGAWLRSLKRQDQALGSQFENLVGDLEIGNRCTFHSEATWPYALGVVAAAAVAFVAMYWQGTSPLQQAAGTIGTLVITGSLAAGVQRRRKRLSIDRFVTGLKGDLQRLGDGLARIAAAADRQEANEPPRVGGVG